MDLNFTKNDWKLFQKRVGDWQESYMDQLTKEYIELLESDAAPSEKFWELDKRIRRDKKHPGVQMRLEKKNMLFDIVDLINLEVIKVKDLEDFSDDLKGSVAELIERRYGLL